MAHDVKKKKKKLKTNSKIIQNVLLDFKCDTKLTRLLYSAFSFLRLLFWAQCGTSAKIERVSLDGNDRKALVTHQIRHPVALSLGKFSPSHDLRLVGKSSSHLFIQRLSRCAPSAAVLA